MPRAATSTARKAPAKKAAAVKPAPDTEEDATESWFSPLDDVEDFTNTLLYGREGGGKTTGACRLANRFSHMPPGKGMILVINSEGGLKKSALRKRGVDTTKIVLWPDPKKHQRATHTGLDQIHRRVKADLQRDPESWGGVIFDSASEIHIAFLDSVQEKRVQTIKNKGQDVDEDFVDISDYGTMSKMFRDVLRKFRDLNCHFVVTALERRDVDKDTGKPQYGPAVTPGIQSDLLGYVDFVLMCKAEDEDGPFRALTRANSRYRAKDRFDILPKVMVDPFMDRIIGYVSEEITEETDIEQKRLPIPKQSKKGKGKNTSDADDDKEEETDAED